MTYRIKINDFFSPCQTFLCGQCFRFEQNNDGSFTGIAQGRAVNISVSENEVVICSSVEDDSDFWAEYLDLNRDYSKIRQTLSKDKTITAAVSYGRGIRILKQDFFECLISFIISANNNIPRIKKIINILSEMYGEEIDFGGKTYYTFPSLAALKGVTERALEPLHAGYRARYIVNTINALTDDFEAEISSLPTDKARKKLCSLCGVGPKVADCILLFAFARFDVFPTDVWVKKIMNLKYGCAEKEANKYGMDRFGSLSGIAQQYLFYYIREEGKKK